MKVLWQEMTLELGYRGQSVEMGVRTSKAFLTEGRAYGNQHEVHQVAGHGHRCQFYRGMCATQII